MAYLKTLFGGNLFGGDRSQSGYSQPRADVNDPSARKDIETQSASVNLEDIIDEYDESSQRSRTTASPSRRPADEQQPNSHSFFSFTGTRDDETTSFYSALHDGFSLDEFDGVTRNGNNNKSGREFLWQKRGHNQNNSDELEVMMPRPDFQVTWTNLTYKIKSSATYTDVWDDFKDKLTTSFSSALALINYFRSDQYDVNDINEVLARDTVTILQGVTGSFRSGELTAIMGPSGAGKTSLLNILARRHETGFTGRLCVSHTDHKIKINSIPQDDHLLETLTARENLLYASKLKNPFSSQDHEKCVNSVGLLLGLSDCLDTRTKSLSGGQQKRLAIAQELLSRPDILILDEPTSGLDSLTCLKTLSVLKDLVKPAKSDMIDPIAIILTIHQPQQEAFRMFDKVYVMATGGITIYDGPPDQCVSYIEKYSGLKMPSDDYNPATFLIEIASGEYGQEPVDALARQVRLDAFGPNAKSMLGATMKSSAITLGMDPEKLQSKAGAKRSLKDLEEMTGSVASVQTVGDPKGKVELFLDPRLVKRSSTSSSNFLYKTIILARRCFKTSLRDPLQMIGRTLFHLLLPFGLVFLLGSEPGTANACPSYQPEYSIKTLMKSDEYLDPERQEQFFLALENIGILFCSMYACVSASIASNTLIFTLDLRTCLKEYHNGWYPLNSYVFGRILANMPLDLTLPVLQMAITYAVSGQNTGADDQYYIRRIIISGSAIVLGSIVGEIMGMVIGIIYLGHITTALFVSQAITLPFVMLSGFVARTKNMSKLVQLLSYTSLYKHCLEAVFIARYGWNVCGCKTQGDFKQVTLTGVSDDLRKFVKNFMSTADEGTDETTTAEAISSPISIALNSTDISTPELEDKEDNDVFQMVAKQLSLFNTYGIEVKSCDQVLPYEMHDFNLSESQLTISFSALIGLLVAMLIVLLLVVKFVSATRTAM